jgi:hypothetical protein
LPRSHGLISATDAADPGRWLSPSHTRDRRERLAPNAGEPFTDQYSNPILEPAAGTSPGMASRVHNTAKGCISPSATSMLSRSDQSIWPVPRESFYKPAAVHNGGYVRASAMDSSDAK